MVAVAQSAGVPVKFPGSGGAVVGMCESAEQLAQVCISPLSSPDLPPESAEQLAQVCISPLSSPYLPSESAEQLAQVRACSRGATAFARFSYAPC